MASAPVAERPAAIADRVARGVIASVPQRLAAATAEAERESIFRLRYQTVIELGWATPEELPEGLEKADDDDEAVQVGAWEGEELVGAARVMLPDGEKPLPIERDFGIEAGNREVEVGRTVIVPRLRGATGHGLIIALFAQCWLEMRARDYIDLLSAVPPRMIEVYRSIGFKITELAGGREHWGEERIPVRFDVLGSAARLSRIWGEAPAETPDPGR